MISSISGNVGGGMQQQPQMNTQAPDVRTAGSKRSGEDPARQTVAAQGSNPAIDLPTGTGAAGNPSPGSQPGAEGSAISEKHETMLDGAREIIQYWESDPRDRVSPEVREQYAAPGEQMESAQSRIDEMAGQMEVGTVSPEPEGTTAEVPEEQIAETPEPSAPTADETVVDPEEAAMQEVQENLSGMQETGQKEPAAGAEQSSPGEITDLFA